MIPSSGIHNDTKKYDIVLDDNIAFVQEMDIHPDIIDFVQNNNINGYYIETIPFDYELKFYDCPTTYREHIVIKKRKDQPISFWYLEISREV